MFLVKLYQRILISNLDQNLIKASQVMAVCIMLFMQFQGKKEPTKSIFQCFKLDFRYFGKNFRNMTKFNRLACWINSKIRNRVSNNILMMFICCHYCCSLLWGNYWRSLIMLWNSTSWSVLKLTVPTELPHHPWDPFLINNYNMTGNSVENHCFIVLNVKLQVKLRFKMFYWL